MFSMSSCVNSLERLKAASLSGVSSGLPMTSRVLYSFCASEWTLG